MTTFNPSGNVDIEDEMLIFIAQALIRQRKETLYIESKLLNIEQIVMALAAKDDKKINQILAQIETGKTKLTQALKEKK